jgi:hypothetical protein
MIIMYIKRNLFDKDNVRYVLSVELITKISVDSEVKRAYCKISKITTTPAKNKSYNTTTASEGVRQFEKDFPIIGKLKKWDDDEFLEESGIRTIANKIVSLNRIKN